MSRFRTQYCHVDSLLNLRNHLHGSQFTQSFKSLSLSSISPRIRASSLQIEERIGSEIVDGSKNNGPDFPVSERGSGNRESALKVKGDSGDSERGVRRLKANSRSFRRKNNPGSLYALLANHQNERAVTREVRMSDNSLIRKELSPDMEMFVTHLYREGYFNYSNVLPDNKLVLSNFENLYGRDFIKFAAERFGRDNQEIAKWLSGSDLKRVALFGCPSVARKNVFAAKTLRKFFRIQEDTVCHKCILRQSCKFVNQSVWNGGTKNLSLAVVMNVIVQYALEAVPQQLVIPEAVKASVNRVLKEIMNLSQTVGRY